MENTPELPPAPPEPAPTQEFHFTLGNYVAPEGKLRGVGFGRRAAARIIDMVFTYILGFIAGSFSGILIAFAASATHQPFRVMAARLQGLHPSLFLASITAAFFYEFISEGLHGSTLGKQVLGMIVVQEDGSPSTLKGAAIRSLAYFVDGMFFGIVGYSAMKRDESRQRYGDDWAHTMVVEKSAIPAEKRRGGGVFAAALALASAANIMTMMIAILMLAIG